MEISVPMNEINTRNIYFGDKRKNIIVDGDFIKIVYSTDSFEMNGLYILTEFGTINHTKRQDPIYIEDQSAVKLGLDNNGTKKPFAILSEMEVVRGLYKRDNEDSSSSHLVQAETRMENEWVKIVSKNSITTPKRNINFNISTKENARVIEQLCQIETDILDRYTASNCPLKTASYVLKNQLLSGLIKYHSENYAVESPLHSKTNSIFEPQLKEECILKISGIWETATNVGITMKFILLQN